MDWTTPLRSQQADFIQRLRSDCLLHCETQGQHSELTVISGERLKQLRDFCWEMADKYKRNSSVRKVFIDNMKGKLAEEVVQVRLIDLVTEVDYEKRISGDGKVDFRLNSDPDVGIQVKARHDSINTVKWRVSQEEVEKNATLVCILIQEEVSEAQAKYNIIMAGFLPTNRIELSDGEASVSINELLYSGGLRSYLGSLKSLEADGFRGQQNQRSKSKQEHQPVIPVFDYFSIGNSCYEKRDYQGAITNYNQALQLNPNFAEAYCWRGAAHYAIGDKISAISDFNQGLWINPNNAIAYSNRGVVHSDIGDKQKAIDDFNQAIEFNPNYARAYYDRAVICSGIRDRLKQVKDFEKAADLFQQQGDQENYQKALEKIGRFDMVTG